MRQIEAAVTANNEVMPGVYLTWMESPQLVAQPGQFFMVRCGGYFLRRPLSLHQLEGDRLAFLFSVVGKGSYWLSQRQVGDRVDLLGPLGRGYSILPAAHNLLLVAGGIGIAPLRFLADVAVKQEKKVTLLMGASSKVNLLPEEQLSRGLLTDGVLPWNINIIKVTDDGSEGLKGLATDVIVNYIDDTDQIFACGPVGMYQALVRYSHQFPKLKSVQVSLEVRMGCGLGVCYGCTVKTKMGLKQVCRDGPVFDLEDILWDELDF
ncbi:MAG: dihydroorotate dehydrogenase electron transfer subunit [Dehalococcoidia bacterium]|nr:MAG: dihydroorotate dehydrogenase electron transfer subunit [Dehalococcoidia bacterium]